MKMTTEDYQINCDEYNGYCVDCDDVTNYGGVEPDAEEYVCKRCEKNTVMGIEQALVCDHIEIVDEDE